MNKLACQYALLRFRPFVETGEFANIGVVLLSPEGRFFGFKLLKKYGRITQFFHQLDAKVYLEGKGLFLEELERFSAQIRQHALDGRKRFPDIALATRLFAELTRPRDAMLHFDEQRVVMAEWACPRKTKSLAEDENSVLEKERWERGKRKSGRGTRWNTSLKR